jgi:hypothetical protein
MFMQNLPGEKYEVGARMIGFPWQGGARWMGRIANPQLRLNRYGLYIVSSQMQGGQWISKQIAQIVRPLTFIFIAV